VLAVDYGHVMLLLSSWRRTRYLCRLIAICGVVYFLLVFVLHRRLRRFDDDDDGNDDDVPDTVADVTPRLAVDNATDDVTEARLSHAFLV